MDSSQRATIDYEVLIQFFDQKIKNSRDKFEYPYPQSVSISTLAKNQNNIRKQLISDYIRVTYKIQSIDFSLAEQIRKVGSNLKKSTISGSLKLPDKIEPPRKRRRVETDDDEYIPSDISDEDDACSSSNCNKEKNRLLKQIEELQEKNRLQEAEIRNLRTENFAQELQSYDDLYPKLCLLNHQLGISVRNTQKFMGFLKSNVKALEKIVVPSHTFIHQQRNLIPTISSKQKTRFIESAKYLTIAVDGTPYRNGHYFAVVLFDQARVVKLI